MEREQILKVMVPVGGFAVLLVIVGAVIALSSGGTAPTRYTDTAVTPVKPSDLLELGSVPLTDEGMTRELPSLSAPEWRPFTPVPGMKIWDVREGTEEHTAIPDSRMTVHYIGWRLDGVSFDSSLKRNEPYTLNLNEMISGWRTGIPGMKVGGIRRLYIPSQYAYGTTGSGRDIPPNADLVFEVKLLRVFRPKQ